MTRLEWVKEYRPHHNFDNLVEDSCPGVFRKDWPVASYEERYIDDKGIVVGCRGKTCKQCWAHEANDDKD